MVYPNGVKSVCRVATGLALAIRLFCSSQVRSFSVMVLSLDSLSAKITLGDLTIEMLVFFSIRVHGEEAL